MVAAWCLPQGGGQPAKESPPPQVSPSIPIKRKTGALMNIVPDQRAVTGLDLGSEPSAAELAAIDIEMPVILADVALLDAQISVLDRPVLPIGRRQLRRAQHQLLVERARLATRLAALKKVVAEIERNVSGVIA